MPTPEEQIATLTKQVEEFKAKGAQTDALEAQVKSMTDQLTQLKEVNQRQTMDLAKTQALSEFPKAAEMSEFIKGGTPEEIKASAKAIHEKILERDKKLFEKHNIKPESEIDAWGKVPGSVPPELIIPNDRQTQYEKVRASQMPVRFKTAELMKMHLEDLHKKFVLGARALLGVR